MLYILLQIYIKSYNGNSNICKWKRKINLTVNWKCKISMTRKFSLMTRPYWKLFMPNGIDSRMLVLRFTFLNKNTQTSSLNHVPSRKILKNSPQKADSWEESFHSKLSEKDSFVNSSYVRPTNKSHDSHFNLHAQFFIFTVIFFPLSCYKTLVLTDTATS